MSRASAGSFAAFFPNAPSVLEKKRKRSSSQAADISAKASVLETSSGPTASNDQSFLTAATSEARSVAERTSAQGFSAREDDEIRSSESGDILNGVGSASSLASTTSSIFSNPHHYSSQTRGVGLASHALTPLTNPEPSPPEKVESPIHAKTTNVVTHMDKSPPTGVPAATSLTDHVSTTITPAHTPPEVRRMVQPALGEVRGFKIHFDPETAEGLTREQRKKSKVKYRTFVMQEVSDDFSPSRWISRTKRSPKLSRPRRNACKLPTQERH